MEFVAENDKNLTTNFFFFFISSFLPSGMRLFKAIVALAALAVISVSASEDKKEIGTVIGIDLGTTYSW